jgi:hypothetical protein
MLRPKGRPHWVGEELARPRRSGRSVVVTAMQVGAEHPGSGLQCICGLSARRASGCQEAFHGIDVLWLPISVRVTPQIESCS